MKYTVHFLPEGASVAVDDGATLLDAQILAGLGVNAPCGGKGTCGKCAVEYRKSGDTVFERVLACRTRVHADAEVRRGIGEGGIEVLTEAVTDVNAPANPLAQCVRLEVPPCPKGKSISDWSRLSRAVRDTVGVHDLDPDASICQSLGRLLNKTRGKIWAVISGSHVLEISTEPKPVLMAAFDLGTTTIAGYLISSETGRVLATGGAPNPQARFGADVISRAEYALGHGPDALRDCVRSAINAMISQMCASAAVPEESICAVMLAGNTAMHHLFLGISPDPLVRAPYNPVISQALDIPARDCGLCTHPKARLYLLPLIGGFVGADTVACLISGDWLQREKTALMIDIGTNGELVLGNRDRRMACSTAAGPALEGAKIACGMRASEGAIDRIWLEDGRLRWHVIGEGTARGICGSGLVDLAAALLLCGAMDESGRLASGERYELGETGVYLTQKDVREVQLAKAAIAAGIHLMCHRMGLTLQDIAQVDIAGAFGNYINPDSACAIGLIPPALRSRIRQVGNGAGRGAQMALQDAAYWAQAASLAAQTEYLELATMPEFQDEFVDQLSFSGEDE